MSHRILIAATVALITAMPASAQNYPSRPVRFIVPFAPGGNTDVQGRLIAQKLSEKWGQQVVVDNRAGAGGTLGVEMLAKAPADGYTIALASFGNILVGPSLFPKLAYDPMKDLAPVILVSLPPGLLVVNPGLPVKNVGELIAYGKANPGKLNFGSSGNGSAPHMAAVLFSRVAPLAIWRYRPPLALTSVTPSTMQAQKTHRLRPLARSTPSPRPATSTRVRKRDSSASTLRSSVIAAGWRRGRGRGAGAPAARR